jgi:hypothetical protein
MGICPFSVPILVIRIDTIADYETPEESMPLAYLFLSLLSAGAIFMTILLIVVVVSPRVHRHPTWISFCAVCESPNRT